MDSEFQPEPQPEPATQPDLTEHSQVQQSDLDQQFTGSRGDGSAYPVNETDPIEPNGLPIEVSNQFWKVDPMNVQVERVSGLIFATVLLIGAIIGLAVVWFVQGELNFVFYVVAIPVAVVLLALFMFAIIWPSLTYRLASWRLDDEGLEIRRGVLWRHRITVPLGRVQHADVSQGPLQRQFGVGTLTIHTAGTQHASIPLEGLTYSTAVELRDLIVGQKKDQHVV